MGLFQVSVVTCGRHDLHLCLWQRQGHVAGNGCEFGIKFTGDQQDGYMQARQARAQGGLDTRAGPAQALCQADYAIAQALAM
jgi:hypothetical protein